MPTKPKSGSERRNLTYEEKLMIIQQKEQEPTWKQDDLAIWARDRFQLVSKPTQSTISYILKSRAKLQNLNVPLHFRSARSVKHPELDAALKEWVLGMVNAKEPVTRDAIQQKATTLAQEMQNVTGMSFSSGWVTSFMKRHQLQVTKKYGVVRADMVTQHQPQQQQQLLPHVAPVVTTTLRTPLFIPDAENGIAPNGTSGVDIVLEWLVAPGNYTRWKLLKSVQAKQRLVAEINHSQFPGVRPLSAMEIRTRISTLVRSFKTAKNWLTEAGMHETYAMERMTGANEVTMHVMNLCRHYDLLVPVLMDYVNDKDGEDEVDIPEPSESWEQSATGEQIDDDPGASKKGKRRGRSTGSPKLSMKLSDKRQQQELFDLEREKLKCDIEAKNVQVMLEKILARKKLLDAGIAPAEVDEYFPM